MKRKWFYAIVIAAGLLIIFLILRFGLRPSSDTAPVTLPSPTPTEASSGVNGEPLESVSPRAEVTPETVQAVIAYLTRAESYSRVITVESFWDGGSSRSEITVNARGGDYLITELTGDVIRNTLMAGGRIWVWYGDDEKDAFSSSLGPDANFDMYQRLLTYEDILELDPAAIVSADYAEYAGESCIRAEYVSGSLGYSHTAYISVTSGLLVGAETRDGDTLIYSMRSEKADLSTPDDELFAPPGN